MRRILLLRHGRTVLQEEGRYVGRTDDPLSAAGVEELLPAGRVPSVVYVSNKQRTAQTAEIVFEWPAKGDAPAAAAAPPPKGGAKK